MTEGGLMKTWKDVKSVHDKIADRLTFAQYTKATTDKNGQAYWCKDPSHKGFFERVKKVTKNKNIVAMCNQALEDIRALTLKVVK